MNDLTTGLKCNVKLFADDTSPFSVAEDTNTSTKDMNLDLGLIRQWAHDWRMSFNPDHQNQAVELIFTRKNIKINHPFLITQR